MEIFCGSVFVLALVATPFILAIAALRKASRAETQLAKLETELSALRSDFRRAQERPAAPVAAPAPPPTPAPVPVPPPVPVPAPAPVPEPIAELPPPPPPIAPPPSVAPPPPIAPPSVAPPPPPRVTPPPTQPPYVPPPPRPPVVKKPFDWEALVGVKLFSWIAGIAVVIAAIAFLKYSVEHGWISPPIRAAIGLLTGSALLVVCELKVARNYAFTANAMLGAGIAILYSTLFAVHALWHLMPAGAVFGGMIIVTAVAVALSLRRNALFISLLGMLGGFATPALLSTGENRPIGLFSYLLLLNAGLAWVAYRKRWPALTIGSAIFSVIYQWAWIAKFLDAAQLPLAAGIFIVFGIAGATALWLRRRDDKQQTMFDRIGQISAALPLLFALFVAAVPAYGARFNILFGFLLLLAAGLGIIAMLRDVEWLHGLGAVATLLTFAIWLGVSYRRIPDAWPIVLAWLSAFIVFYLAIGLRYRSSLVIAAGALFFVFPALVQIEPRAASPVLLFVTLFVLLALAAAYAIRYEEGLVYFVAAFFAIVTETLWSVKHLTGDRLYAGLAIYAIFGFLFLGIPALARRFQRTLKPESGMTVTVVVSLAMLLFLTFDRVAAGALWGLAILLAVMLIGTIAEARFTAKPALAVVAVILSWIVLASWWEAASLEAALIPALFVIAIFGVLVILASAWAGKATGSPSFSNQTHLALAGHVFLIFVAAQRSLAYPPWPFLAVLAVLDLAVGVAALYLRRGSLLIGSAVLSQIVLIVFASHAERWPYPHVALISALVVALYAVVWYVLAKQEKVFARAAMAALLLGHLVAIGAGASAVPPVFTSLLFTHAALAIITLILA
ncbi:MAG TPA: DUF2339 domain-containing protein, partial [Thermoanaerobaculia bacterium]|nr:DUF2339 domain-containing protein [Thermoanaerobaculia bacterium]